MADRTVACGNSTINVTAWTACYNRADDIIVVSCTVTSSDDNINGVGVILNTAQGSTLASTYAELSNGNKSVTPALNLPPGSLKVGDPVSCVVSGEAGGQHFFVQDQLTIESC